MRCSHCKCWLIYLLIIGVYSLTTLAYGDFEYNYNDDTNTSQHSTFDKMIESVYGRHRVRRAVGGTTITDTSKCILFLNHFYIFSLKSS
jgi:hypothetical protein